MAAVRTLAGIVASLRLRRWVKNLAFFAALLFSRNLAHRPLLAVSAVGFALLCLASGGLYLVNDVLDRAEDRRHPGKRHRPVASGRVSVPAATIAAAVLVVPALAVSFALDRSFGTWMAGYVGLGLAYSLGLKRVPIVDLFVQGFLFLLRIVAGAVLIRVPISHWLLLCSLLLSLFLALARRRYELTSEETPQDSHAFLHYSTYLVDQMIAVVTSATLIAYTLYTFSPETTAKVGSRNLVYTVPFVLYGIFRYLYVIYQKDTERPPDWELFLDRPLLINSALYLLVAAIVLYGR